MAGAFGDRYVTVACMQRAQLRLLQTGHWMGITPVSARTAVAVASGELKVRQRRRVTDSL